jgi:hypothetical protein
MTKKLFIQTKYFYALGRGIYICEGSFCDKEYEIKNQYPNCFYFAKNKEQAARKAEALNEVISKE